MIDMPFKKLAVWMKSMSLVHEVYLITRDFPKEEVYGLTSQMRRCAVSVPSNIAEGSQRTSDKEFVHFVLIAKGSLAELNTQTEIAHQLKYIKDASYRLLIEKIEEVDRMLRAFYKTLTASR